MLGREEKDKKEQLRGEWRGERGLGGKNKRHRERPNIYLPSGSAAGVPMSTDDVDAQDDTALRLL